MSEGPTTSGSFAAERFVCVVMHDVAPATRAACARTLAAVAAVADLPVTLLAVPQYHDQPPTPDLEEWLGGRSRKGDEIALHGWNHRDDLAPVGTLDLLRRRLYTRGEGEFWALPEDEAKRRLDAGIDWFASQGWPLAGFVAPAWLLGPGAWAALAASGRFEYTATLRQMVHLPGRRAVNSQSVVYSTSSGWRRQSSLLWNGVVARLERANPVLRIELHPRDADFSEVRRSWQAILERALRDRRASTVADFMRHNRAGGATTVAPSTQAPTTQWQATTTAD
ncbi:MAG: polysaccharide deacetylase family protein [Caldimonas sp.]